jgi:mannosyltransferase
MTLSQVSGSRGISITNLQSIGLVGVLIVAAAFRFYDLDRTSIWFDEALSWWLASHSLYDMSAIIAIDFPDPTPPLHLILLHFTIALFGDSETALRAPSALLGVATIYLVYRLGGVLWDRTTGLIAALFLALSGFHIWYSTEARTYALLAFIATLFVFTVVHATRRPSWLTLAGCAAAGTALLYTHTYGAFLFLGINLTVLTAILWRVDPVRVGFWQWVVTQAIPCVIFVPWAALVIIHAGHISVLMSWIGRPTFEWIDYTLTQIAGGQPQLIILLVLVGLSLINPVRKRNWLQFDYAHLITLTWLIAPFFIALIISLMIQPILIPRYLICSLPALMLLAAQGLTNLALNRNIKIGLVTIVSASLLAAAYELSAVAQRDDNRAGAAYFVARALPTDLVVFHNSANEYSYKYYARNYKFNEVSFYEIVNSQRDLTGVNRIWFLTWLAPDSDVKAFTETMSGSFDVVEEQRYSSGWLGAPSAIQLFKRKETGPQ